MPLEAGQIAELRTLASAMPDSGALAALETTNELLAYVVAWSRSEGRSEVDDVEMVIRAADMTPDEVRASERVLRRLGYGAVAARLQALAGRRRHRLAPLVPDRAASL